MNNLQYHKNQPKILDIGIGYPIEGIVDQLQAP